MEPDVIAVDMLVIIFIVSVLSSLIEFLSNCLLGEMKGMMRMAIEFLTDIVTGFFVKIIEAALLA